MKLRNKLIPIFSVAAATTVAAPLVSCGNISTSSMDMIDVLHGYQPTVDRAEGAVNLTTAQVQDIYIQDVKANPNIMIQDLAWYESLALKNRLLRAANIFRKNMLIDYGLYPATESHEFTMIPQVAKFGMSDITIQDVKLVNPYTEKEETVNTISMKFNYEFEYELVADCAYGIDRYQANRVAKLALTSEYKNIPFNVRYDTEYGTWMVEPIGWYDLTSADSDEAIAKTTWMLRKLTNYSFKFDLKAVFTDTIKDYNGNTDTYTYDESQGGLIDSYSSFLSWMRGLEDEDLESTVRQYMFNFGSYHLYDVMGPRWTYGNLGNYGSISTDAVEKETDTEMTRHLDKQMRYNWSYAEERAQTCPTRDKTTGKIATLLNSSELTFAVELFNDETKAWEQIGSVTFADYDSAKGSGSFDDSCTMVISLSANFTFNTAENKEAYKKFMNDNSKARFVIPANTTFKFETYVMDQKQRKTVAKELDCKIEDAINCFWKASITENI